MSTSHRQALAWEARSSRRRHAALDAVLRTAGGDRRVAILNLSTGGALLDTAEPPAPGDPVTLARDALAVSGRVGWVNENRFGVTFDHAIDETAVQAMARPATA